ncbi:MAG: PAS domain S-box protein, partial [Proteobacteria bacterium]|nr:PAS domain S-box protein [Pseudomonadota bacterium]
LGTVLVGRPADMPPDGQGEREWSEKYGFRPTLFTPMILGGVLYGAVGFYGPVDEERDWPEDFVLWLKFVADILVNALERKRAEEAMREISERFEKLAEASFDGIVLMENGILVEVNRTFASLYGYEPNEVIGMNAVDFIAPESKALVQNNVASGYDKPYEAIVLRKDGTKFAVEACGTAVTHKGRQARITAMRDITERKRAEESLRESEAMLAQAQQLAHLGNWEWDIINNKRTWSDEFYRILGLEPQAVEASFETFMERTHPDDREYVAKVEKELMAGHKSSVTLEHRMVQPDGTERFIQGRIRPQFDKKAKLVKMVGTMLDITERKQAEEALRESEEKYRSLVENIPDVTWTTDRAGNTTFASPNIEKVYGYTPEELYEAGDRLWLGRIHPDDLEQVQQAYELLFSKNKMFDIEYRIQRKDGAWIWGRDRA